MRGQATERAGLVLLSAKYENKEETPSRISQSTDASRLKGGLPTLDSRTSPLAHVV